MATALIGFGANLGSPGETLSQAVQTINSNDRVQVTHVSCALTTFPVGSGDEQPLYTNAAIRIETSMSAESLLTLLFDVEKRFGRIRDAKNPERWISRSIDLDLLLYDHQNIDLPGIKVPHPRMSFRRFVLEPANEIAAELIHPVAGVSIADLLGIIEKKNFFILLAIAEKYDPLDLIERLVHAGSEFDFELVNPLTAKTNIDELQKPCPAKPGTKQKIWICFVNTKDDFEHLKELAQLVVVLISANERPEKQTWPQAARNFAGPSLSIDLSKSGDANQIGIVHELTAACQAMMPIPQPT